MFMASYIQAEPHAGLIPIIISMWRCGPAYKRNNLSSFTSAFPLLCFLSLTSPCPATSRVLEAPAGLA